MEQLTEKYDAIVAGAGLWGCTIARRLADNGKHVLVVDPRKCIGGNCSCIAINGIEVHEYGSHVFHTSNEEVWKFVNRFARFSNYEHHVFSMHDGKGYHLPIGRTLVREFLGKDVPPSDLSDDDKKSIFDAFIKGYTSKQWGIPPEEVDPSVISRLKVRDSDSIDYFSDSHEGIPIDGYNDMMNNMLSNSGIDLSLNTEFTIAHESGKLEWDRETPVFYSGPIDKLFGYRYGKLPWRSLRFEIEVLDIDDFQGYPMVNYPDMDVEFTRIHEFRHFHTEGYGPYSHPSGTVISREFPVEWKEGLDPYYPIKSEYSDSILSKYVEEAKNYPLITIGGRLGSYKYLDMDKTIAEALNVDIESCFL